MKLGLSIGYSGAELKLPVEKVLLAERLGFDSVWTAEAYGSDAITRPPPASASTVPAAMAAVAGGRAASCMMPVPRRMRLVRAAR